MKRIIFFSLSIFIYLASFSQIHVNLQNSKTNATIINDNQYGLSFSSQLEGFEVIAVKTKDNHYSRLIVPEYYPDNIVSNPELPVLSKLIEVPLDAEFEVRILSFKEQVINLNEYGIELPILPNQPSVSKSDDFDKLQFYKNSKIYTDKEFYETELVKVELLSKMRGIQIAQITVSPFSYDIESNTLIIRNNIEAEIIYRNVDFQKSAQLKADKYSPAFGAAYNSLWNYKSPVSKYVVSNYPIKYVIISDRMFESALNSFIKWKTKKGFYVTVKYTDEIGTTNTAIKNYLKGLYDAGTQEDPAPTFVLLVGDVAQIPSFQIGTQHVSDMYYCEYDGGSDFIPEVYFGRFSATNVAQLNPQIEKTLMFEQYTFPDPNFLGKVVLVAGVDSNFGSTHANGQVNYANNYYFNEEHGLNQVNKYLYPQSGQSAAAIREKIGQGVAIANYTAHCDESGWADPSFTKSHIPALTNEDKYFFSIGNCCLSNKFEQAECFGEALLRANKKGAVVHIGGSNSTYWDEDFYWSVGVASTINTSVTYELSSQAAYDHLFHDRGEIPYPSAAEIIYAGNMAVNESNSTRKKYYWEIYHVMGDPSLMPYAGVPDEIQANYLPNLFIGMNSLTVNTEPNAYIAISLNNQLLDAKLADENGTATLSFNNLNTVGTASIVVTKQFKAPHIQDVPIIPNDNDYDAMLSLMINPTNNIHINNASFQPSVEIMNLGQQNLTTVDVGYTLDNQEPVIINWTGNLEFIEAETVNFPQITLSEGEHSFTAFVNNPNEQVDQYPDNDQINRDVLVYSGKVKIESIQAPEDKYCNSNSFAPIITIKNLDNEILSSCLISYSCNSISDQVLWTGNLQQNETTQITFPQNSFPDGNNSIVFTIENVNGGYNFSNNNNLDKNFTIIPVGHLIVFDILSDYYPNENSWELTNSETSEVIVSKSLSNPNSHHIEEICLGEGCYNFKITDSYGDGMGGSVWYNPAKGSVKITNSTTSQVLWEYTNNGNWSSKSFDFCINISNIKEYNSNIDVYPNPSTGIIIIENNSKINNISVYNNLGQIVYNHDFNDEFISLDLKEYPNGIYFVKISDNQNVVTKKVTLSK